MKSPILNIYVEGKDDKNFIDTIIKHKLKPKSTFSVISTSGWQGIGKIQNDLEANKLANGKNIIIFDADNNPIERRKDILKLVKDKKNIDEIFLFPNNNDIGNLETLLEKIINPTNKQILNCFEDYKKCVSSFNHNISVPDDKAKIFTYISVLGKEASCEKRDYLDTELWDLNNFYLENVLKFINDFLI